MTTIEEPKLKADPVITEVHAIKQAVIDEHNGDLTSFFAGIRERQAKNPRLIAVPEAEQAVPPKSDRAGG